MTYRVAVIGTGKLGQRHARHWRTLEGAEIVGALDKNLEVARSFGAGDAFDDFDALIAQTKPDIIDICTPTPSHREYIERAAAAGKAIFVEKPLGRTREDCDAAVRAVAKANVPFMAGHVVRFFPEMAAAKHLIASGGIGKPAAIRTSRMAGMPTEGTWFSDPKQSGGVVLDLILHDFDWLRWCFGEVERVFAKGMASRKDYNGRLDYALVTLRFVSGTIAHVTGSWAHVVGFRTTLEIAGDAGMIEYDSARNLPLTTMRRAGGLTTESPFGAEQDPFRLELSAFLDALRNGTESPVTLQDAYAAVQIALAAIESIETGRAVTLS